ncbi:MAG: MG2 domain-containing protein, partial [Planctomycetota bacterium]
MKTEEPVEPRWEWFGSRAFWEVVGTVALGLILLVGGYTVWMATREPDPQEVFLYAADSFTPGQPVGVRVFVRDGRSHRGVRAADVELALLGNDGTRSWTATGETGKEGFLNVTARLPAELPEGDYTVHLTADSTYGKSEVRHDVQVARSFRALVTTDKPLYQPGQTIHIRTLALAAADRRPVAGRAVVLEVRDAKGNKVFKKITKTSDYGIVSGDFQLADQVNLGTYTVAAHIGDTTSERTVRVERYRLPKFRVDLTTDRSYYRPGETLTGDLSAEYAFGKPVARGRVRITAAQSGKPAEPFAAIDGQTDADGRFHFRLDLNHDFAQLEDKKAAAVLLEATLTDPADHAQQTRIERPVTTRPIRIELFPGSGRLVRGVENIVYILTVYADGRPAKTTLTIDDGRETLQTSDAGIAQITVTPTSAEVTLTVRAEDERGVGAGVIETLPVGPRHESILLRTDRAVYRTGKTAELTVLSADRAGRVFVDVVKDRQVVVMKAIEIEDGRGRLKLDLPADLFGTLAIRAHRVLADGHLISDSRVIQVNRVDDLQIEATVDKETYRPAETALLRFLVTRTDGEPAQAALSLAAVDEAVFALQ